MDYKYYNGKFNEDKLEEAIIELFRQQGYTPVTGNTIHRKYEEVLLKDDMKSFLLSSYPDLTETEIKTAISMLENIQASPLYEGNREAYRLYSEGFDLVREDPTKLAVHINYIDFDHKDNNIFKIINQYTVVDVETRTPDALVFINGIPVAIFEFKSAIQEGKTIFDAWKQVTIRYRRDLPNLLKYCSMAVISDGANNKLGTIFTPYEFFYAWNKANDEDKVSNGINSLFTLIEGAFAQDRILDILRDFIFYPDKSDKEKVIICRYPQYFGAKKMLANIKEHSKPQGDGKGGLYFGATGCGKTYTMLYLTRLLKLRETNVFGNPTIVLIVDREDLDDQACDDFEVATVYLHEHHDEKEKIQTVRSIESRDDLSTTLSLQKSGGVFITTIQKFCEGIGELSSRNNIICISDEAHRTQTGIGPQLKKTENGYETTFGFAEYLRISFPNATYCGFTGTPVDASKKVFGDIVDQYTMDEAVDDGITVRITYDPRLARVLVSDDDVRAIQEYYERCEMMGSNPEQIEKSKKEMSNMRIILGNSERIKKLSRDIVTHYEQLCDNKPNIVQKAMIVCNDRILAYRVYKEILSLRPEWGIKKECTNDSKVEKKDKKKCKEIAKMNLVATRDPDDEKDLYDLLGTKEHRKDLADEFKDEKSNFTIAIVVDMWMTGFDVPSLAVMYIDKPLQRHTLIQTISRVNRVFEGKDNGIIVDYIGIKTAMMRALKEFGANQKSPFDEIEVTLGIFRNHLKMIDDLLCNFNATKFFVGEPLDRLICLNNAAEFIQMSKEMENRFMGLSRRLKAAYNIVFQTGELTEEEIKKSQFYMAIRSIIYKQTIGTAPDAEVMNRTVEKMVERALITTGVENIFDANKSIDIFSQEFKDKLSNVKMPITKFNALVKLLREAINSYGKVNRVKAIDFEERLKKVVDDYNTRDNLVFTSEVVADFIEQLSEKVLDIYKDLEKDKTSFEKMGITFEEKAFYDILVKVRDERKFEYQDDKCVYLAKEIKKLVSDKAQFGDWLNREDIKSQLSMELVKLLYNNGYPPEWNNEVFEKVLQQAENFKKYS